MGGGGYVCSLCQIGGIRPPLRGRLYVGRQRQIPVGGGSQCCGSGGGCTGKGGWQCVWRWWCGFIGGVGRASPFFSEMGVHHLNHLNPSSNRVVALDGVVHHPAEMRLCWGIKHPCLRRSPGKSLVWAPKPRQQQHPPSPAPPTHKTLTNQITRTPRPPPIDPARTTPPYEGCCKHPIS